MFNLFKMIINIEKPTERLDNPASVAKIFQAVLGSFDDVDQQKEHLFALLLDTRHKFMSIDLVSVGTINSSIVHPRETFRRAILAGASYIVIAHNHPSGDPTPSPDDVLTTARLKEAGKLLGIPVIDHIVFTSDRYKRVDFSQ